MSRQREWCWVVGVLALALGLRLFAALGHEGGAWSVGTCDEPFVLEAESILRSGNPLHLEAFSYPPVPAIITAAGAGLWGTVGGGDVAAQCRVITLVFSVATVGVVYMVGRLWGQRYGLIAMTLYAVAMIAVVVQGNVQVYSTFFLLLAFYHLLRGEPEAKTGYRVLAGVWLGLGVASKYVPLLFAGMLFAPYLLDRWTKEEVVAGQVVEGAAGESGKVGARVWTGGVSLVVAIAAAMVWTGTVERDWVYALLRRLYEQRPHENAFEYHLASINRLYRVGLAAVGIAGMVGALTLVVPWVRHISPWQWARLFYARNRLWVAPCAALILTIGVTLGVPAVLNLQDFARNFVFQARVGTAGDNGFFPANRPAVSYILGFIPESLGLALFIAGLIGLAYVAIRRDRRAIIVIASAIPAYVVLELSSIKVNRYALELMPLWCLLAAVWLGDLWGKSDRRWRLVGACAVLAVATYSLSYSLAWAEFSSPRGDVRKEAGRWLNTTIPSGSSLGARSGLMVSGAPELLPEAAFLTKYRLVDYADDPDYVLLPTSVYEVMRQYLEAVRDGYEYSADDWWPSAPSAKDLAVLSRIVREDGYVLMKEFRKRPTLLGLEVRSDSLRGRTWYVEHGAVGIRIYRRPKEHG